MSAGRPHPRVTRAWATCFSLLSEPAIMQPGLTECKTQPRPSPLTQRCQALGPVASAPLLEDAVDLLQHVTQALVLGCPAGQGDLKQARLVSQDCLAVPAWPHPHSCPPRPKCCGVKGLA